MDNLDFLWCWYIAWDTEFEYWTKIGFIQQNRGVTMATEQAVIIIFSWNYSHWFPTSVFSLFVQLQACPPFQPSCFSACASSSPSPLFSPVWSGTTASASPHPSYQDTTWWGRALTWSPCSVKEPTWLMWRPTSTKMAPVHSAPTLFKAKGWRK